MMLVTIAAALSTRLVGSYRVFTICTFAVVTGGGVVAVGVGLGGVVGVPVGVGVGLGVGVDVFVGLTVGLGVAPLPGSTHPLSSAPIRASPSIAAAPLPTRTVPTVQDPSRRAEPCPGDSPHGADRRTARDQAREAPSGSQK